MPLVWTGWVPSLVQGGYHGEEQSEQELQEQEHTAEAPLQMCSQRILGVWLLFWLWLSLTPVLVM